MSRRTYDLTTRAAVLVVVMAALLYGRSPLLTSLAAVLGCFGALVAAFAYFRRLSDPTPHVVAGAVGSIATSTEQQPPRQTAGEGERLSGYEWHTVLADRDASKGCNRFVFWDNARGEPQDAVLVELLHSLCSVSYGASTQVSYGSLSKFQTTPDYIVDIATRLYSSDVGNKLECEVTRDGRFVMRLRGSEDPQQREPESLLEGLGIEEQWPHLKSKPI